MKTIEGTLSIGRNSRDGYYIEMRDENSRVSFARAVMTAEQFAQVFTGLNGVHIEIRVGNLDLVGKVKVSENRSVVTNIKTYSKDVARKWLHENAQEDGWIINDHLGSQNSFGSEGNFTVLNYSVYKYIDQEN